MPGGARLISFLILIAMSVSKSVKTTSFQNDGQPGKSVLN